MNLLATLALLALAVRTALPLPELRDIRALPLDPGVPPTVAADREVDTVRIGLISRLGTGEDAAAAAGPAADVAAIDVAAIDVAAIDVAAGARLAVEQANVEGGVGGRPVVLVVRSSEGPWSQAARRVVELVHGERVWAILAGPDRDTAHLALQVCTKAHTPVLLPFTEDDSLTLGGVPWVFRLASNAGPGDLQPAPSTEPFVRLWRARHRSPPTTAAALGWDAVRLVVEGLREVGLDRAGLRDWLAAAKRRPGATGTISFCPNGDRRPQGGCPGVP